MWSSSVNQDTNRQKGEKEIPKQLPQCCYIHHNCKGITLFRCKKLHMSYSIYQTLIVSLIFLSLDCCGLLWSWRTRLLRVASPAVQSIYQNSNQIVKIIRLKTTIKDSARVSCKQINRKNSRAFTGWKDGSAYSVLPFRKSTASWAAYNIIFLTYKSHTQLLVSNNNFRHQARCSWTSREMFNSKKARLMAKHLKFIFSCSVVHG